MKINSNEFQNTIINFGENLNAPLSKPIETVQNTIENSLYDIVDVAENEKRKKSNKAAIAAGSSIIVLSGLVLLFNPKYSNKLIEKARLIREKNNRSMVTDKNDTFLNTLKKFKTKVSDLFINSLEFTNNINSVKDIYFKKLCSKVRTPRNDNFVSGILQKTNELFVRIMKPVHEKITLWGDKIAQKTIVVKYKSVAKKRSTLGKIINQCMSDLSETEKRQIQNLLFDAGNESKAFTPAEIMHRLKKQEELMKDLEPEVIKKFKNYTNGFSQEKDKQAHFEKNLYFWAQDIMMPQRNVVEKEGIERISKLIGNDKNTTGIYTKIIEIMRNNKSLSRQQIKELEKALEKYDKALKNANESECIKYFDKKRDLVLGSAPTDILTAVISLSASGIVISTTKDKDKKISRCLTGVFPIITGLGATMIFTAMLFSGTTGLLLGAATSVILSKVGSFLDNQRIKHKQQKENNDNEVLV